jgi:hypothetical protein
MTNKEAIDYNNNLKEYMKITDKKSKYKFLQENYEALDMAIQALEQQTCDCISRDEAIRVAEQGQIQGYEWEFKKLCNLPSVTPSYNSIKTELEPSADCISRAKALEMLGDEPENWTDTEKEIQEVNNYRWFKSILEELPPVTPQQRVGKWIQTKDDCDGVNFYDFSFECSKCGREQSFKSNYCPNCGAKMEVNADV